MATIRFDASDLIKRLENAETKTQIAIKIYSQEGAKKFENYAKQNRPWIDRTGHARQRVIGWVETMPLKTRIYIGHGVDYGIHLELGHEKKYAILFPTVKALSQQILEGYEELIKYFK